MVGLLEDVSQHVRIPFRRAGDLIALLGETRDELGASEFLRSVHGRDEGPCPEINLDAERRLIDLLVRLAEERRLASAHDVSDGGLAVALTECAMESGLGVEIRLEPGLRPSALLFGETTGRAVITFSVEEESAVRSSAEAARIPFSVIGRVGGESLRVEVGGRVLVDEPLAALRELWTTAFARAIESAAEVL
jgi:phosphoribosylformylglycinamidine synthase